MNKDSRETLAARVASLQQEDFEATALTVFHYQASANPIYAQYLKLLRKEAASVGRLADIPYLPIALFKHYPLQTGGSWQAVQIFSSSGTTGVHTSRHLLRDEDWYKQLASKAFQAIYGDLSDWIVLALLPSYLERGGSSLVFMAEAFIRQSQSALSGFYLHDLRGLSDLLAREKNSGQQILLIGVSFALLDLAEQFPQNLPDNVVVMETGGMKGRRRELTRQELHAQLKSSFGLRYIHSEYGMTELLSQAYAPRDGLFYPAPTMRVLSRELSDPLSIRTDAQTGALNIIDLANLDTISFIATDDLGRVYPDHTFEVLGRMDASDTRGCNLLLGNI